MTGTGLTRKGAMGLSTEMMVKSILFTIPIFT